jgi:hypothetical protein
VIDESYCDPRLNFEQSLGELWRFEACAVVGETLTFQRNHPDVAFMISNEYASSRASSSEANHIYTELSRVSSIEN